MKKLISLFLTVVLALSLMPSAFAAEGASVDKFTDVPADAWYKEELAYAVYNGYISGTSATTFSPDSLVTRGQFVTILGRMLKVDTSAYTSSKFTDVDMGSWYGPYVAWAASNRYVNGTSSTTFAPGNNITMEQMGTILSNYIFNSGVVLWDTTPIEQYADAGSISGWAKDSMERMRRYDLLPVDGKGNVSPRKAATRAEATVSLVRLAKAVGFGVDPSISYSPDDVGALVEAKIQSVHEELRASGAIKDGMSEKEKAIAYLKWLCMNCRNSRMNEEDFVLCNGHRVWAGYTSYGPLIRGYGNDCGLGEVYARFLGDVGIAFHVDGIYYQIFYLTLDGVEYEVPVGTCVAWSKDADGSFSEHAWGLYREKYFYPEEWQKQFEGGFGDPLTEEEIQQLLGG